MIFSVEHWGTNLKRADRLDISVRKDMKVTIQTGGYSYPKLGIEHQYDLS